MVSVMICYSHCDIKTPYVNIQTDGIPTLGDSELFRYWFRSIRNSLEVHAAYVCREGVNAKFGLRYVVWVNVAQVTGA